MALNFRKVHILGADGFSADALCDQICTECHIAPDELLNWLAGLMQPTYWVRPHDRIVEEVFSPAQQDYLRIWEAEAGETLLQAVRRMVPNLLSARTQPPDGLARFCGRDLAPVQAGAVHALSYLIDEDSAGKTGLTRLLALKALDADEHRNCDRFLAEVLEQTETPGPEATDWVFQLYDHCIQSVAWDLEASDQTESSSATRKAGSSGSATAENRRDDGRCEL